MGEKRRISQDNDQACCQAAATISLLAGKWTIDIILSLAVGKKRFAALQRLLPGISHHVLTKELKRLQASGIIFRTVYPTTPPSVEYELTSAGMALRTVLHAASEWATHYLVETTYASGDQGITR